MEEISLYAFCIVLLYCYIIVFTTHRLKITKPSQQLAVTIYIAFLTFDDPIQNAFQLHSSPNWCYFDALSNNHNRFTQDHILKVDVAKSALAVARMISMTKFDASKTVKRWLCILKKQLSKQLTTATWLKRTNA